MTDRKDVWPVRLTTTAESDFVNIIDWTADRFGTAQASAYTSTLLDALESLQQGADEFGVKPLDFPESGIFTLHAARGGRRARHFIVFRIESDVNSTYIQVLRILHDSMDLSRHGSEAP